MSTAGHRGSSVIDVAVEAANVPDPVKEEFVVAVRGYHSGLAEVAPAGMPARTTVILTAAFEATVTAHLMGAPSSEGAAEFQAARLGGAHAVAKTIARDPGYDEVVIVFDAGTWSAHGERAGHERLLEHFLVCHELSHALFERVAAASGAVVGAEGPPYTPGEIARAMSRILNHEYRADRLADTLCSGLFSTRRDGVTVPSHIWDLMADSRRDGLHDTLCAAYADGPGAVLNYRCGRIDLISMWRGVVRVTEDLLTQWVHARAEADAVEALLLGHSSLQQLPFVRLYLADTLPPLVDAMRTGPLMMTPGGWRDLDAAVIAAGERALREIWRRLGLTFTEPSGSLFTIHVTDPLVIS